MPNKNPDLRIYRSLRPDHNLSLDDTRALVKRLQHAGFRIERIEVHPMGDGMGWGATAPLSAKEVLDAGVPANEPVQWMIQFAGPEGRGQDNAALVQQTFGEGSLEGLQRMYASINPGDLFGWVSQLLAVPRMVEAINGVLTGAKKEK